MGKEERIILLIDDDPVLIRMLERILGADGYHVLSALNGNDGLALAKEKQPHLILLDLIMPDPNGMEVARQLTNDESTRDIPIVFMTVRLKVEDDKGNLEIDVDGRLCRAFAKPLHNAKLLSAIRKIINARLNEN